MRKSKEGIKKVKTPLSATDIDKQFQQFKKARRTFKYIITNKGVSIVPGSAPFIPEGKNYPDTFVTYFLRGTSKGTKMFYKNAKSMSAKRRVEIQSKTKNFKVVKTKTGYVASWEGYNR